MNHKNRITNKRNQDRLLPTLALTATNATAAFLITVTPAQLLADSSHRDDTAQHRLSENGESSRTAKHHSHSGSRRTTTLDGYGNNKDNPTLGTAGQLYSRIAPANYADGNSLILEGPELRYLSNRIFADHTQNLFSENSVTQWAYNWGQFIDHTIGLRANGTESMEITFDESDPLEFYTNSAENLRVTRSAAAEGTGVTTPREHINTVSSYIDGWAVYGGTEERLEWLREGPVDGDLNNNSAKLLLTDSQYLPTASIRGDAASAPVMERVGMLRAMPNADDLVVITGDQRANENIALTTVQTLFAREHNRIVDLLPDDLSEQKKFDLAREFVIATQQYITYNEFLPAVGVNLDVPSGYQPGVDPTVSHEFATVGYRAHSMIHGEIEMEVSADRYSDAQIQGFQAQGIEIVQEGGDMELAVPLNIAFANPQLVTSLGLGPIAAGLGGEPQYKNDETIDNQLRSVLFQLPNPEITDPDSCLDGPDLPACFLLASDIGVLDVFRGRDHGIADYNTLREAYGLARVTSFVQITGETTEEFPENDTEIDSASPINDPNIMDYIELRDLDGNELEPGSDAADAEAITGIRRTTLAARLKAIYSTVDGIDAFVGMVSENHIPGTEFGELQYAMWKTQFEALRDGDSNFYLWNKNLEKITEKYKAQGIIYQQTLADIIANNTELTHDDIQSNMFISQD